MPTPDRRGQTVAAAWLREALFSHYTTPQNRSFVIDALADCAGAMGSPAACLVEGSKLLLGHTPLILHASLAGGLGQMQTVTCAAARTTLICRAGEPFFET
jgi:hypothetical protein